MRSTRTIIFGCALVVAALVFLSLYRAISRMNNPVPVAQTGSSPGVDGNVTNVSTRSAGEIAVAATDIPAGAIVTREMLKMKPYSGPATTGFVTDLDDQAVGFITRVAIPADAQIRPSEDFIGHISQVGIAGALQPGMRALVLPLPGKPTLHDLVKIGNSVDVIASFDGQEARTIAQNMRVLAVDVFANDFPQVNAAMRGPYKADAQGKGIKASPAAPGASDASANAAPDSVEPAANPTPVPENAPKPDPSLTLEVTPQQAAAIQLAQASGAPIDFLVRPALPGNRSGDIALVGEEGTPGAEGGAGALTVTSVTKRQIAPYAEAVKNAGRSNKNSGNTARNNAPGNGEVRTASTGRTRRTPMALPGDFPSITETSGNKNSPPTPYYPPSNPEFGGSGSNGGNTPLAPASPSTYQIPIYADGGVVRTETVPVPMPRQ